tara:strand:+ start:26388 stop:27923 length:1536 start_codon:yes stop_codon:yes gene_type:complete
MFLTCKIETKENRQNKAKIIQIDSIQFKQNALVKVVSDDSLVLKSVHLTGIYHLFNDDGNRVIKTFNKDTTVMSILNLERPQIVHFNAVGTNINYMSRFLISPGDNVLLTIKDKIINATGKNSAHYNFYPEMDSSNTTYAYIPFKGDLKDYKKRVKENYLKRKHLFNTYIGKHNVTDGFKTIMGAQLQHNYLYNLMGPTSKKIKYKNHYFYLNNFDNFLTEEIQKIDVEKNGFFDIGEYFDHVSIEDFNKTELLNNHFFRVNLIFFIRQYFLDSGNANYSKSKFLEEKKFIQDNFEEEIETFAIARLLLDYHKNSFGLGKENNDLLIQTIDMYYERFSKDDSYKEKIDDLKQSLNNIDSKLSNELLQTKLIDLKGDTISLAKVFSKSKNKNKIVDFWASWCLPCIDEIQKSQSIRRSLTNNKNIDLIYFSIDKKKSAWIKSSKKLAKYGVLNNQYLIPNFKSTELYYYLKVKSVPRYVIFNKRNEIMVEDGPRPTDSIRFKQVLNEILMKK